VHTRVGAGVRLLRNGLFAFVLDVARECAQLLEEWPADVVVFDWMLAGAAVAAERARLPAVALVHCPYPLPVEGAPPLFSGMKPMAGRAGALRDGVLNDFAARLLARGLPILNKARSEQGLEPLLTWESQLLGAEAIYVMSAPELDFSSRGRLPGNVHYVGPAFEPFEDEWKSPWPATNSDPLVVISFSTSYMDQEALAQRVLDAVGKLHVRALLTAGPALNASALQLPPNARSVAFVPHRTVLPHAALMVTHAGWQTVNAALTDGVPLLCIPDGRDQPDNAARVVLARAGLRVAKRTSVGKLRRVIAGALEDPTLKRGADTMAAALTRSDGAACVVGHLEGLARTRNLT
jgi:MGT family glycosyltransferase